jgi:hypothetical protein
MASTATPARLPRPDNAATAALPGQHKPQRTLARGAGQAAGRAAPDGQRSIMIATRLLPLLFCLVSAPAPAALVAYTDSAAFLGALRGDVATQDFDGLSAGVVSGAVLPLTLSGGATGATVTLPGAIPDPLGGPSFDAAVVANGVDNLNPTRSAPNSLGSTDSDNFNTITAGALLDFAFSRPVTGFGLWLITPETVVDGDATLTAGGTTAALSVADREDLGLFDSVAFYAYFLGITAGSSAEDFAAVSLTSPGSALGAFYYNLDDFTAGITPAAAPAPGALALLLPGIAGIAVLRRRQARAPCRRHAPRP